MKSRLIISIIIMSCSAALADFVTIGDTSNTADTTGFGAVGYEYQISKYEVTATEFATAVASDPTIGTAEGTGDTPVVNVTWYEAAKYCNWLTTGNASTGAYTFNDDGSVDAMSHSVIAEGNSLYYVLPTEDEWYKAAYYTQNSTYSLYAFAPDHAPLESESNYSATGLWSVGSGLEEQNGTFDMMGNAYEWLEEQDGTDGILRGGYYAEGSDKLDSSNRLNDTPLLTALDGGGFRIVAIPEPATLLLFAIGGIMSAGAARFKRQK